MSATNTPVSCKLFIRAFLSRPCLLEDEAKTLLQNCNEAEGSIEDVANPARLDAFVTQCNRMLDAVDMTIMRVTHPNRDMNYYILTNFKHDEISKLATSYKPPILETFKKVVHLISQSPTGTISSTAILNSIPSTAISKSAFESTILREWEQDYWLEEVDEGVYTLGIRTLNDLKEYLREEFEDAKRCQLCEEVVLMPISCPCRQSFFHRMCLRAHSIRDDVNCSNCNHNVRPQ